MTYKEELIDVFESAIRDEIEYIAIAVETEGIPDWEIIINPLENLKNKLEYYKKAYNDNLVLNTYAGIKIVSMYAFDGDTNLDTVNETLKDYEFI